MKRTILKLALVAIAALPEGVDGSVTLTPPLPRPSIPSRFDYSKPLHLVGHLVQIELENPSAQLYVDAGTTHWWVQAGSPAFLARHGLTKATLHQGAAVVIDAHPAKNGYNLAYGLSITLEDGITLELNFRPY